MMLIIDAWLTGFTAGMEGRGRETQAADRKRDGKIQGSDMEKKMYDIGKEKGV